jgi:threonine/homoserine/homoserine lactone efflux protein
MMPPPVILNFLLKGVAIGLAIAAPVGPIGLLCIRRTLEQGRGAGLACGLGAATADAAYGCVAGFGLTVISNFLMTQTTWLHLAGGVFLCYLGVLTFRRASAQRAPQASAGDLGSDYLSTLLLTLANPMTILSFVAVFAGFGLAVSPSYLIAGTLVAGVFVGSALWWLFLSTCVAWMRHRVSDVWMQAVNRLSGSAIVAFGLYSLSTLVPR